MIIPNLVAYSALALWPVVSFIFFQMMPVRKAIIWSILGGYLLLPVSTGFDAPGIPNMDKTLISNLAVAVWAVTFARFKVIAIPRNKILVGLMLLYAVSPFFTMLTNQEPLRLSASTLPGMTFYDGLSIVTKQILHLLPFLIGYNAFKTEGDIREVLKALVMAALAYSILILWEIRVSPQLHSQLYGFFPHSFAQQMRAGGFRPVVFLGHGLVVAIFVAMAMVAAIGLWRNRTQVFGFNGIIYISILLFVLILCKSLGAVVLVTIVGFTLYFIRYRTIISVLAIFGLIIFSYPLMRGTGLIPVNNIAEISADFSSDRGASFQTRVDNEEMLLEKAAQKPLFGWGTWGRDRIYMADWSGKFDIDVSITDGTWIIILGTFGWAGYISTFGLLTFPTARAFHRRKQFAQFPVYVALLAVLVVNLLDLLPNSSMSPVTWFAAGILAGFMPAAKKILKTSRSPEQVERQDMCTSNAKGSKI